MPSKYRRQREAVRQTYGDPDEILAEERDTEWYSKLLAHADNLITLAYDREAAVNCFSAATCGGIWYHQRLRASESPWRQRVLRLEKEIAGLVYKGLVPGVTRGTRIFK